MTDPDAGNNTNLPRNSFKTFTSYRLPGDLNRWRVGGGLHVQSDIYTSDGIEQGGYAVTDLFAFRPEDFRLDGYDPWPHIPAKVAV